ncbi:MAG: FecR domain-containing protein [Elusimicrobia bacterium]|nr:FecR domain-containing protein [Elusimicrobiota bacterium]
MNSKLIGVFLALCALCPPSSIVYGAEKYGIISRFAGDVALRRGGEKNFTGLKGKEFLFIGDSLRTGPKSQVAILMTDGSEVKINERSMVTLDKVEDRDSTGVRRWIRSIFMESGQSWLKLLHGKSSQSMAIHSNTAVCAVRGTEAAVSVTPGKKKKIKVKIKKSQLLKQGLEKTKKDLKEAYEKEARAKREAELAKLKKEEDERRRAEEELRKAEEERRRAEEEARKAQEDADKAQKEKDKDVVVEKIVDDQQMVVAVLEGLIEVMNEHGSQNVGAGQVLSMGAGETPPPPEDMKDDDKPKWQEGITVSDDEKENLIKDLEGGATSYTPAGGDDEKPDEKTLNIEVEQEGGSKRKVQMKFRKR